MTTQTLLQIQINDRALQVEKGLTILQAARKHGIEIPTLCDFPGLPSYGSCRLCIVEIKGQANTPTACTTPVEEGLVIYTHSPKVEALRKTLLEMLLAEHPSACLYCPERHNCDECMVTVRKAAMTTGCGSCPKDSQCELQALAEQYQITQPSFPMRYRMVPVEKMDPFFDRDYNLCILCGRCIRVCEDLHFNNALAYTKRGTHALVGTAFYQTHLEASCTFCGACVEICPTGALSGKTRKWAGSPESLTASTCPLCSLGCQINLLAREDRIIGSLPDRIAGTDALCVKGRFGITELVNHPTRLKRPMQREGQTWLGTRWEEAIQDAAKKLAACPPQGFELRISSDCTNEDLYVAAKFTHAVMNSSRLYTAALAQYGAGVMAVSRLLKESKPVETIQSADTVLCLGLEDRYAQTVIEVQLHRAKKKGAKIVTLSAGKLPWSIHADEWLQVAPGQAGELIQELAKQTAPGAMNTRESSALARAVRLLRQANAPVLIIGPAALTDPAALCCVEVLVRNLHAQVVALPEPVNLAGALQFGLFSGDPALAGKPTDLLYLIGEAIPAQTTGQPFIIYQNLYPPTDSPSGCMADLLLPAAAFSEAEGSYTDAAGRTRSTQPAVSPAGDALPNWLILSRIAQAMGAPGFGYERVVDIRSESAGLT